MEWTSRPRYRYAAIFGSALGAAFMTHYGLTDFADANFVLKAWLLICASFFGAMQGFFFMVVFDQIIGRLR